MADKITAVKTKSLSFKYGERQILKDISLTMYPGRIYGIIGPNGSGKTTFLKNICALLEVESNKVFIQGTDITRMEHKEIAKALAVVPQNTLIDFDFTVFDIVMMGRSPYLKKMQKESSKDVNIVKKAMEACGISHLASRSIFEISGGEMQRVILARALAQDTKILMLDEPVSQLDIHHQLAIMQTIKKLSIQKGITAVIVLHDLNLASNFCDYLYLLKEGKIFSSGIPQEVLTFENIERVYQITCLVYENPISKRPHIIPVESK